MVFEDATRGTKVYLERQSDLVLPLFVCHFANAAILKPFSFELQLGLLGDWAHRPCSLSRWYASSSPNTHIRNMSLPKTQVGVHHATTQQPPPKIAKETTNIVRECKATRNIYASRRKSSTGLSSCIHHVQHQQCSHFLYTPPSSICMQHKRVHKMLPLTPLMTSVSHDHKHLLGGQKKEATALSVLWAEILHRKCSR